MNETAKADPVRALEWYAEQVAGCRKIGSAGDGFRRALDADGGERARAVLAQQAGAAVAWLVEWVDASGDPVSRLAHDSDEAAGMVSTLADAVAATSVVSGLYTAPQPAIPEVDLEQFRPAVEAWKRDAESRHHAGEIFPEQEDAIWDKADRLLALIDAQHNREGE